MKLGTKGQYAVLAMVDLASHSLDAGGDESRPVPLTDIAERQSLPLPYLEQLFAKLRRARLVESTRGQAGGYSLTQDASCLTIAEILTAVGVKLQATRCDSGSPKKCTGLSTHCMTHHLWAGLGNQMHQYLSNVTLADVCRKKIPGSSSLEVRP